MENPRKLEAVYEIIMVEWLSDIFDYIYSSTDKMSDSGTLSLSGMQIPCITNDNDMISTFLETVLVWHKPYWAEAQQTLGPNIPIITTSYLHSSSSASSYAKNGLVKEQGPWHWRTHNPVSRQPLNVVLVLIRE